MKIYNSLSRSKQSLNPINNNVSIYVCGITPYDTTHIGHAFVYVFFDVVIRYLKYKGINVTYTQNVTDIDDDILRQAKKENRNWKELGKYWTDIFLRDMNELNVKPPNYYPKATDAISDILETISVLVNKGAAYEVNGNVYFNVLRFRNFGKLSRLNKKEMTTLLKERGGDPDDHNKKNPLDFILWQQSAEGEPYWDSPWGKGRPGWHIECSAMIKKTLGEQIDIHGGGSDLIYPHHESEIAQSETVNGGGKFVKNWMHIAMVSYKGEKMSKSLGNLAMISELLKKHSPNSIRYLLLSHHYRKEWEFSTEELESAEREVASIQNVLNNDSKFGTINDKLIWRFEKALDDDFNTPEALKIVKEIVKNLPKIRGDKLLDIQTTLRLFLEILGFKF